MPQVKILYAERNNVVVDGAEAFAYRAVGVVVPEVPAFERDFLLEAGEHYIFGIDSPLAREHARRRER